MTKFYDSIDAPWLNVTTAITGKKASDEGYETAKTFGKVVSTAGNLFSIYNGIAGYLNPKILPSPAMPTFADYEPGGGVDINNMTDEQFDIFNQLIDAEFDIDDTGMDWDPDGTPTDVEPFNPNEVFIDREAPFQSLFTEDQWARLGAPETESQTFNQLGAVFGTLSVANNVYDYTRHGVPVAVAPISGPFVGNNSLPNNGVPNQQQTVYFPSSKSITPQIYSSNYIPNNRTILQWHPSATKRRNRKRPKIRHA